MLKLGSRTPLGPVKSRAASEQKSAVMIAIEPGRCRAWSYHHRDQDGLTREGCADLIESIQKYGQREPVLVRALQSAGKDFEIISGVRRWFACAQIPLQKLLVCVIEADDRSCMRLMYAENADSQDISDFEWACAFARHLKSGAFKHQRDLARSLGLGQSTLSKMIKASALFDHPCLAVLFESKREIPLGLAYQLSSLLKKSVFYMKIEAEAGVLLAEKKCRHPKLSAKTILKRLIQCVQAAAPMTSV